MNQTGDDPSLLMATMVMLKQIKAMEIKKATVFSMARPFVR